MSSVRLVQRWLLIDLRRRWLTLGVGTLVIAVVGGMVMATIAGARRGESSLERLQRHRQPATAVIFANTPKFDWNRVRALPEVASLTNFVTRYPFYFDGVGHDIGVAGRSLDTSLSGAFAPTDDQLFRTIERPVVLEGRLYDPTRDDEVVVSRGFVDHTGKGVGDTLTMTLPSPAELRAGVDGTAPDLSGPTITLHIVGVVRSPWISDTADSPGAAVLSPGVVLAHQSNTIGAASSVNNPGWVNALVRLNQGADDLPSFRTSLIAATHRPDIQVWDLPARSRDQEREIGFESRCLLAFGVVAGIVALFAFAQASARSTANAVDELDALRGSGLTTRQEVLLTTVSAATTALAGGVLAGVIAIIASRWFPIATAAYLDPHPGTSVDWVVIGPGVAIIFLALTAMTASAALVARPSPHRATRTSRSFVASFAAKRHLPIPALVGTRLALEPGAGRNALPVRPTLLGAVAGVLGVVAAMTFSGGVQDAARSPDRYGQTFQLGAFIGQNGLNYYPASQIATSIGTRPDVAAVGDIRESVATAAGGRSSVSLFAMAQRPNQLAIVVTSGRAPSAPDEVLLAPRSLASTHASIGSIVRLTGNKNSAAYRVTGIGFVPQGSPSQVYADGGWLSPSGYTRIFTGFRFHFMAVTVTPGNDPTEVATALHRQVAAAFPRSSSLTFDPSVPPVEIFQLRQVRALPLLLGAFLALLAVAALGHGLVTAVRRRAPDLAVLRAVGLTPRQCQLAVLTQAAITATIGLGFGIPLGIALGRTVWRSVAHYEPLKYVAPPSALIVLVCIPAAIIVAMIIAVYPARRAARMSLGQVLRTE